MLGVPSTDGAANPAAAPVVQLPPLQQQQTAATVAESGGSSEGGVGGGGGGGDMTIGGGFNEEGERNSSGNRWPRQETLALLRIRSEMDIVFRDSSLKGPLWEEVSRKMADLGFHRSAKKCKEKFENVYKYHRRTKEGRASKSDGKTYRFFDELEAFAANTNSSHHHHSLQPPPLAATPITMAMPMRGNSTMSMSLSQNNTTVSSTHQNPLTAPTTVTPSSVVNHPLNNVSSMPVLSQPQPQPQQPPPPPSVQPNITLNQMNNQGQGNASFVSNSMSSSSTSSDEDIQRRHGKKRKWKEFFEGLMKDVLVKQEELQKKFMETLEKRERERMVREETWRVQEMARMNREHDLLVQERSMAAAKDATIIAFLQKITGQQNIQIPNSTNTSPTQVQLHLPEKALATTPPHSQPQKQTQQQPPPPPAQPVPLANVAVSLPMTIHAPVPTQVPSLPIPKIHEPPKSDNGGENFTQPSSSRWPKEEIEALIRLRTCLDLKYQENVPKGPLWEEISSGMRKLGYNRNAKRCKEKWENINKYYKKVKESNKKRPEDSKTCPYFHQLEELYKEKAKNEQIVQQNNTVAGFGLKPEINHPLIPIMAQPEQQWPIHQDPPQQQPQPQQQQQQQGIMNDNESDSMDEDEDMDDEDDDGEEEDEGNVYEIVTNKQQQQQPSSMAAATTTAATATV